MTLHQRCTYYWKFIENLDLMYKILYLRDFHQMVYIRCLLDGQWIYHTLYPCHVDIVNIHQISNAYIVLKKQKVIKEYVPFYNDETQQVHIEDIAVLTYGFVLKNKQYNVLSWIGEPLYEHLTTAPPGVLENLTSPPLHLARIPAITPCPFHLRASSTLVMDFYN